MCLQKGRVESLFGLHVIYGVTPTVVTDLQVRRPHVGVVKRLWGEGGIPGEWSTGKKDQNDGYMSGPVELQWRVYLLTMGSGTKYQTKTPLGLTLSNPVNGF